MKSICKVKILAAIFFCFFCHSFSEEKKFDIDLTKMNPTFTYVQVFNMLNEPERYEGKLVKVKGLFYKRTFDENGEEKSSYSCIIQDATACCAQGLSFEPVNVLEDDFPERGATITVSGVFHAYHEKKITRIALTNACFE